MKEEIIKALTIIEEEEGRVKRDIEIIHKAKEEIEKLTKANRKLQRIANKNEVENFVLKETIKEALDKLTIKQLRFINETDYVLDDNDLDEIMKILDKGEDK